MPLLCPKRAERAQTRNNSWVFLINVRRSRQTHRNLLNIKYILNCVHASSEVSDGGSTDLPWWCLQSCTIHVLQQKQCCFLRPALRVASIINIAGCVVFLPKSFYQKYQDKKWKARVFWTSPRRSDPPLPGAAIYMRTRRTQSLTEPKRSQRQRS